MNITHVFNYYTSAYKPCFNKTSFTSNSRIIKQENTNDIYQTTSLFRNDLDWKPFIYDLSDHFKDKEHVNVYSLACSDGSEPVSLAMLLTDRLEKEKAFKFFPILASDNDPYIINVAKSRKINLTSFDIDAAYRNLRTYPEDYLMPVTKDRPLKNDLLQNSRTYTIRKDISNCIRYKNANIKDELLKLKDNSNTVVFCRNVFAYLNVQDQMDIVKIASEKLKSGSLFVIGHYDFETNIHKYLLENGFKRFSNDYIYEKI